MYVLLKSQPLKVGFFYAIELILYIQLSTTISLLLHFLLSLQKYSFAGAKTEKPNE